MSVCYILGTTAELVIYYISVQGRKWPSTKVGQGTNSDPHIFRIPYNLLHCWYYNRMGNCLAIFGFVEALKKTYPLDSNGRSIEKVQLISFSVNTNSINCKGLGMSLVPNSSCISTLRYDALTISVLFGHINITQIRPWYSGVAEIHNFQLNTNPANCKRLGKSLGPNSSPYPNFEIWRYDTFGLVRTY